MDNQNNFMDKKTLIAAALVGVLFMGWQSYLNKKYPKTEVQTPVAAPQAATVTAKEPTASPAASAVAQPNPANPPSAAVPVSEEKIFQYQNSAISFELTSLGMGLKNVILKDHTDLQHQPYKMNILEGRSLYSLSLIGNPLPIPFQITQKGDHEFEGVAQVGNQKIIRTMQINPETHALQNTVRVENLEAGFPGVMVEIPEKSIGEVSHSIFMPTFENQELMVVHSSREERFISSAASEKIEKTFPNVSVMAIGSQYFTSAMVDKSEIIPEAHLVGGKGSPEVVARLLYKPAPGGKENMELKWLGFSGGKSLPVLEKIDADFKHVLDLGFFATLGRWLLYTMQWFHTKIPNWGVAIILLTLLVRVLVLPLNVTTFRSTKKMQKLQPLINSLRERYKEDPQAMNREMMALWKEHKVNPLGGCLPMLLQLPIFFALYRVLGQSIELYQAPFFGWIQDLSLKDPYYVLPALLAVAMFIQQKITPTTMDPTQAKVMQFLPLIFALMMINLPAGLTLYIFVNTLSGIILQQIFMHDRAASATAKEAKA